MAIKIKTREEALEVLRKMVQRKRELEKRIQEEMLQARKDAENCYANL